MSDLMKKRQTIMDKKPPNLIVDFVPEVCGNFYYGFDAHGEIHRLRSVDTNDPEIINETKIDIWNPSFNFDYWFRSSEYKNHILLTDFSGFSIYTLGLELVFHIDIESEKHYVDVYGYEIIDDQLFTWLMNDARNINNSISYTDKSGVPAELLVNYDLRYIFSPGG
jgi:hypothetical protein